MSLNAKKGAKGKAKSNLRMVNVPYAQVAEYSGRPATTKKSGRFGICEGSDLVQSLSGTTGFNATIVRFNPGLSTFASLSIQAQRYDKYRVRKLRLLYYPDVAVVTTQGRVYLAPEYDLRDNAPSSLAYLMAYEGVKNNVAHKPIVLELDPRIMFGGVQHKRVRCGPIGSDLEMFDAVSFVIATDNCSGTGALGQIMVEYEIEFSAYQLEPAIMSPSAFARYNLSSAQALTSTVEATLLYDEVSIDGLDIAPSSGLFTLPCGMFEVYGYVSVSDTANEYLSVSGQVELDSAALSPPVNFAAAATGTLVKAVCPFNAYVTSDGTAVLRVRVTATGAAGTLTAAADRCCITIRAL
jgi:hypothetical protein